MILEPYLGLNLRQYLQYTEPSLMDGVTPESNISDDPMEDWSQFSEISSAASDIVHGTHNYALQFVRVGGSG